MFGLNCKGTLWSCQKMTMEWEFTIKKSDEVRVDHEKKTNEVRVNHEKVDGVRDHDEKERWGESLP